MTVTFLPTDEQRTAVDAYLTGENVTILAGAGTGKTSTLQFVAQARPDKRGLYVAFNKSLQLEAQRKFAGTSVESRTMHSLAFRGFGAPFADRLNAKYMFWNDKAKVLGVNEKFPNGLSYISRQTIVRLAGETVDKFCKSLGTEITVDMVPIPDTLVLSAAADAPFRDLVAGFARRYWADIVDPDGVIPWTHDYYLKRYALSEPLLDYDFIMLDEGQDADPTMTGILQSQQAQLLTVGDPQQAIYAWRGAQDALDKFGGTRTQLTQSFRFGQAIAAEANFWLELLESPMRLRGLDGKPSSVWKSERQPEAVLTRSNAGSIRAILDAQRDGIAVGVAGERKVRELTALAKAAKDLQESGRTNHRDLDVFSSWSEVVAFTQDENEGSDIATLVKVIDDYGADTVLKALDATVPVDKAQQVVSTAHVAKGLEWLHVKVADDFRAPGNDSEGNPKPMVREEARLAYVAVTRAQRHLDPSGLDWAKTFTGGVA